VLPQSEGFNCGHMVHPLAGSVNYGDIGGMSKDPKLRSIQFRQAGNSEKPFDPAMLAVHRALFLDGKELRVRSFIVRKANTDRPLL